MTYPANTVFLPLAKIDHLVTAAEAAANSVAIVLPYECTRAMVQIQTVTTGADYITAKTVLVTHVDGTSCTCTIAGTDLLENSIIVGFAW